MKKVLFPLTLILFLSLGAVNTANAKSQNKGGNSTSKEAVFPEINQMVLSMSATMVPGFIMYAPDDLADAIADHYNNFVRAYDKKQHNLLKNSLRSLIHDVTLLKDEIEKEDGPSILIPMCNMALTIWTNTLDGL